MKIELTFHEANRILNTLPLFTLDKLQAQALLRVRRAIEEGFHLKQIRTDDLISANIDLCPTAWHEIAFLIEDENDSPLTELDLDILRKIDAGMALEL